MAFVKVSPGKSHKDILEQLVQTKKELRNESTERVLEEKGFEQNADALFKGVLDEAKKNRDTLVLNREAANRGQAEILQGLRAIEDAVSEENPLVSLFDNERPAIRECPRGDKFNIIHPKFAEIYSDVVKSKNLSTGNVIEPENDGRLFSMDMKLK